VTGPCCHNSGQQFVKQPAFFLANVVTWFTSVEGVFYLWGITSQQPSFSSMSLSASPVPWERACYWRTHSTISGPAAYTPPTDGHPAGSEVAGPPSIEQARASEQLVEMMINCPGVAGNSVLSSLPSEAAKRASCASCSAVGG
jgi:hypothetical protein